MRRSESYRYAVRITADKRIYEDLRKGNVTIKYPKGCRKCKKHENNLRRKSKPSSPMSKPSKPSSPMSKPSNRYIFSKPSSPMSKPSNRYKSITQQCQNDHLHTHSYRGQEPHYTSKSPVNWQKSPLVTPIDKNVDCFIPSSTNMEQVSPSIPPPVSDNDQVSFRIQRTNTQRNNNIKNYISSSPYIVVNIPASTFAANLNTHSNQHSNHDETSTVVSDIVRCRYCLGNECDGVNNESLISPCLCSGFSKYVHKSCLEKWLTLRNLSECEVCKTEYETKWIHTSLCTKKFPPIEKRDVFLLFLTISFYITLIFQLLGAVYVSIMAELLPPMIRTITLFGLSLGLFWFMIGCITLTIVTYTSAYWKKWRNSNKKKIIVLRSNNYKMKKEESTAFVNASEWSENGDETQHPLVEVIDMSRPVPV